MASTTKRRSRDSKTRLASILDELRERGFDPELSEESYANIAESGLRPMNWGLAFVAAALALREQPITLRGLFYRVVSAGFLPSTDKKHYDRMGRLMTTLREAGIVPFHWLVDNLRSTIKPSSWSGLTDFADTVRNAYRMDFWERLLDYVHVFVEKDAMAGVLAPVTREFDVALSPIRGYTSLSFAHEIASHWSDIRKPIHAYYLGDFDPSGMDLERDLVTKLRRYCTRGFTWNRLAVLPEDFDDFDLLPLQPKKSDRRYAAFVESHGTQCAELDALPATEIRRRVREAIEAHIPAGEWERLQANEATERSDWNDLMDQLSA